MCFAFDAVSGVTSPPTATRPRHPSVLSARGSTPRETTAALLRDAGWEEAVCAHTLRQSARTVEALMGRGRMPARPGGSLSTQRGGGDRRTHHEGRRGRLLVRRPRASRRRYRRSRWRRWRERSMGPWRSSDLCLFSFRLCSMFLGVKGGVFSFLFV